MKGAQNRRCTSSMCEQSLHKSLIWRNENFGVIDYGKPGYPKVLRADGVKPLLFSY